MTRLRVTRALSDDGWVVREIDEDNAVFYRDGSRGGGAWRLDDGGYRAQQVIGTCDARAARSRAPFVRWLRRLYAGECSIVRRQS